MACFLWRCDGHAAICHDASAAGCDASDQRFWRIRLFPPASRAAAAHVDDAEPDAHAQPDTSQSSTLCAGCGCGSSSRGSGESAELGDSAGCSWRQPWVETVTFTLNSRDVIHSFWIPDFRVKMDVFPNRYTGYTFDTPTLAEGENHPAWHPS